MDFNLLFFCARRTLLYSTQRVVNKLQIFLCLTKFQHSPSFFIVCSVASSQHRGNNVCAMGLTKILCNFISKFWNSKLDLFWHCQHLSIYFKKKSHFHTLLSIKKHANCIKKKLINKYKVSQNIAPNWKKISVHDNYLEAFFGQFVKKQKCSQISRFHVLKEALLF